MNKRRAAPWYRRLLFRRGLTAVFVLIKTAFLCAAIGAAFTASAASCSLVSFNPSRWTVQSATMGKTTSTATVALNSDVLLLSNTKGLWPQATSLLDAPLSFPVDGGRIVYDFTPGKRTSILLLFRDGQGNSQSVTMNPAVSGAAFVSTTGEINASAKALSGSISLQGLRTGNYSSGIYQGKTVDSLADDDGQITLLGVTIVVSGDAAGMIQLRELSAVVADPPATTTTKAPTKPLLTTVSTAEPTAEPSATASSATGRPSPSYGSSWAGSSDTSAPASGNSSGGSRSGGLSQGGSSYSAGGSPADGEPASHSGTGHSGTAGASGSGNESPVAQTVRGDRPSSGSQGALSTRTLSGKVITVLMVVAGGGVLLAAWRFFRPPSPQSKR